MGRCRLSRRRACSRLAASLGHEACRPPVPVSVARMSETKRESASRRLPPAPPCFLADRMLGRLAKWLRILGYDTAYLPQLSSTGLKREARRQGRLLLTRRTCFVRQKDVPPFVFVRADRFREQLAQVCNELQLDTAARVLTRCSVCNRVLNEIAREHVRRRVPEYVWQTQTSFLACDTCRRVYWPATHRARVLAELRRLNLAVE